MESENYAIVIATRNRPEALKLSIPRMLSQSLPPKQLIIIDSSENFDDTVKAVKETVGGYSGELIVERSQPSASGQRNLGLSYVKEPVVFFPDDDSIWFPETARHVMDVYKKDNRLEIAAVCAAESPKPPPDWETQESRGYSMRLSHKFQQQIGSLRAKIEHKIFPDPAYILGRSFRQEHLPEWFQSEKVKVVEWMTGFRMTFRTNVIRDVMFDEIFEKYSLFEDIDASLGAMKHGMVVGATKARVYHYRSPENRLDGYMAGVKQLLNKAYVIAKRAPDKHPARKKAPKFFEYKVFQYRLGKRRGRFGAERYNGASSVLKRAVELSKASPIEAASLYGETIKEMVAKRQNGNSE